VNEESTIELNIKKYFYNTQNCVGVSVYVGALYVRLVVTNSTPQENEQKVFRWVVVEKREEKFS
jgi:hypothetical protein